MRASSKKPIEDYLFQGYIVIIYGARQVGKTRLIQHIISRYLDKHTLYISGEEVDIQEKLKPTTYTHYKE